MKIYSEIFEKMNGVIKTSIAPFVDGDTNTINLFGLANSYVMANDATAPMVNLNGELSYLWDLDYPITGYHRLINTDIVPNKSKSFGGKIHIAVNNSIDLVIIGKRNAVITDPETLAMSISSQLFDIQINANNVKGHTQAKGFKTDPLAILKSEFQGKDYDLKYNNADYFFLKVNYSLTLEMVANCLTC